MWPVVHAKVTKIFKQNIFSSCFFFTKDIGCSHFCNATFQTFKADRAIKYLFTYPLQKLKHELIWPKNTTSRPCSSSQTKSIPSGHILVSSWIVAWYRLRKSSSYDTAICTTKMSFYSMNRMTWQLLMPPFIQRHLHGLVSINFLYWAH